ncbi:MAG: ATP-binding protein [Candidatus Thiodiazotropha sp. (ex Epidulcina cf. delphinae)]|nr:ATP-binding protein [Candidatus Thiodiazotropha sp. (ex Epidulcina cf. delphinae)]
MGWSGAFDWDKLLESKRVLIISEAGAGKTYECRNQQQALWNKDESAFYLDLAQLATNNLRDLLSADEEARLEAWLAAQAEVATFFLDSIDELKLTLGSFEIALKRLNKAIAGQLGRVRIVITTRPIAIDQQLIQQYLPVPDSVELIVSGDVFADIAMGRQQKGSGQEEQGATPVWRNVALMPLSDEQIREMAVIEGIDDADALLADIRARNAEDFARRPQDLIELCADWRDHHRISTHREQVAHNIRVKLKPRADRRERAQLSPDKALEGACRLALAVLLTRKLTLRLSVEADLGGEPGTALDPEKVLHDWAPDERKTLLERAIFGFASYGRVRFHNRSVVEFLAAQNLDDLLGRGMPIKALKRLLFAETPQGIKVVRPTMRPVAAWLAASQPSIFSEVRDREPDLLLDHADPESLPPTQRKEALRSYVRLYGQGGSRGLYVPRIQVHRFASPDLANSVLDLWQTGIENHEVRKLLLELIGTGPMPVCADAAHDVATDGTATEGERLDAIEALVRLNDPRVDVLTLSMVDAPALWPDSLVGGAIVRVFPQHIAPDRLCEVLKRIQKSAKFIDQFEWVLPRNITAFEFAPGYLEALLAGMTDLVIEDLVWEKEPPHLVSKRTYLVSALAAVCLRLIQAGETDAEVLHSSVIALRLKHDHHTHDDPLQNLRKALAELMPPLREATFWAEDAFIESLHPQVDPWKRLFRASYHGPLTLNDTQDGIWVQRILADPERALPERMMMLYALMCGLLEGVSNSQDYVEGLKPSVTDEPKLIALIEHRLSPKEVDPKIAKHEAQIERRRNTVKRRKAKEHAGWVAFWREVSEDPDTVFNTGREDNTVWNLWQAMKRSGDESRASGWNRRFIEQYFGKEVAVRLRASMRSIWRNDRPTLRYERPANERGRFLIRWQLGLAAIAAEAEDSDWARKLSVEEAELAARYAPIELNGFPVWLEVLAREHPDAVERTLGPELTAELDEITTTPSFGMVLQDISYAPDTVKRLFLLRLHAWLDAHTDNLRKNEDETAAVGRLERVLEILITLGDEERRRHIVFMAEDKLKAANDGPFMLTWLMILMRLDPATGTDALESLLAPLEPAATGLAVDVFGHMFGDRASNLLVDLRGPGFTPALLLRLVQLVYRYVRPSDDITHEEIYSPGPRDRAQEGRDALLSEILDTKGTEAWAVKLEMVDDPLFAHFRDWLTRSAREKAAEDADGAVFTESEVAIFDRYGEAPPTTRNDMFSMLVDRLDDLDDLLLQDISPRAAWANIKDEKMMRQQIALQLHYASNHVYTVDQEAVTADEKETDIRLRVASSCQEATIELKIGECWSGKVLRDTIKRQLVTKYMAAESCRSGCLLVTVASGLRIWKHPETAERLDIEGLRAMLETEATRIVNDLGGCLRLAVKVLDLRPRLAAESHSKAKAGGEDNGEA